MKAKYDSIYYDKNNPTKLPIKNIIHNNYRQLIENLHTQEIQ